MLKNEYLQTRPDGRLLRDYNYISDYVAYKNYVYQKAGSHPNADRLMNILNDIKEDVPEVDETSEEYVEYVDRKIKIIMDQQKLDLQDSWQTKMKLRKAGDEEPEDLTLKLYSLTKPEVLTIRKEVKAKLFAKLKEKEDAE
ncbi:hypothetical protein HK099_000856, partial [Clydaea vesicula]